MKNKNSSKNQLQSILFKAQSVFHLKPNFFIIGTQKGGTTSLYNYLAQHPCVLPAEKKEIHFFSDNFDLGFDWYLNQFPNVFNKISRKFKCSGEVLTGEATPYYLFHPHAPGRIRSFCPDAKFIMMLRNPVDRAFSHYQYHVKLGVEKLSFREAIHAEAQRLDGEYEKMLADATYQSVNYKNYSYLKRGVYIEQVKPWFELFSKDKILVIKSEDFFANPEECFNEVQKFLGLSKHVFSTYKKFNAGNQHSIEEDLRQQLLEYFRPYNQQLYEFLGTDFGWDK